MIYFIGGAPRVGKSVLAKSLSDKLNVQSLNTDDVCESAMSQSSPDDRLAKFPCPGFSGNASENVLTPAQRIDLQFVTAQSLEPKIMDAAITALRENRDLLIEGSQILPQTVRRLAQDYGADNFCVIFLGSTDPDLVFDGILDNSNPQNWLSPENREVVAQVAEFVADFSRRIKAEAESWECIYIEKSEDFETDLKKWEISLLGQKRRQ